MIALNTSKFVSMASDVKEVDVGKIQEERKAKDELFHKTVYETMSLQECQNIAFSELVNMIEEVSYHFGGKLPESKNVEEFICRLFKSKGILQSRIL